METPEETILKEIREEIEKEDLTDVVTEYIPDLLMDGILEMIAKMHGVILTSHWIGEFPEEADFVYFELRPSELAKDLPNRKESGFKKVAKLILSQLDCCDSAIIEEYDIEGGYMRFKTEGHYHS